MSGSSFHAKKIIVTSCRTERQSRRKKRRGKYSGYGNNSAGKLAGSSGKQRADKQETRPPAERRNQIAGNSASRLSGSLDEKETRPENSLGDMTTRKRISSPKHEKKKYGEKETGEKEVITIKKR